MKTGADSTAGNPETQDPVERILYLADYSGDCRTQSVERLLEQCLEGVRAVAAWSSALKACGPWPQRTRCARRGRWW